MIYLSVVIAFLLTFSVLPVVIRLFKSIDLLDAPDRRKIHRQSTPTLGGIGIFIGFVIPLLFTIPFIEFAENKFFFAGIILMLFLGMRDDISSINANYKITFQVIAALMVIHYGDLRLTGLYGMFGVGEFPYIVSVLLTLFVFIALTNAYNLIDGIDGLAGSICLLACLLFGSWFLLNDDMVFSVVAFTLAGSVGAFLMFNWHPAKIFMGDTGSIFIGFLLTCFSLRFINSSSTLTNEFYLIESYIGLTVAILIVPIYDTLRVMSIRIRAGISPFMPDKKHIHHILLKQGFNHSSATMVLLSFNLLCVIVALSLSALGDGVVIVVMASLAILFGYIADRRLKQHYRSVSRDRSNMKDMFVSKSA